MSGIMKDAAYQEAKKTNSEAISRALADAIVSGTEVKTDTEVKANFVFQTVVSGEAKDRAIDSMSVSSAQTAKATADILFDMIINKKAPQPYCHKGKLPFSSTPERCPRWDSNPQAKSGGF